MLVCNGSTILFLARQRGIVVLEGEEVYHALAKVDVFATTTERYLLVKTNVSSVDGSIEGIDTSAMGPLIVSVMP